MLLYAPLILAIAILLIGVIYYTYAISAAAFRFSQKSTDYDKINAIGTHGAKIDGMNIHAYLKKDAEPTIPSPKLKKPLLFSIESGRLRFKVKQHNQNNDSVEGVFDLLERVDLYRDGTLVKCSKDGTRSKTKLGHDDMEYISQNMHITLGTYPEGGLKHQPDGEYVLKVYRDSDVKVCYPWSCSMLITDSHAQAKLLGLLKIDDDSLKSRKS